MKVTCLSSSTLAVYTFTLSSMQETGLAGDIEVKIISSILAATVAITSVPASAHWQYTTWGMTPAQVIVASNGAAHPGSGAQSAQRDGTTADVEGSYNANGRVFATQFYFQSGSLVRVVLEGKDWQSCVQTAHDLQAVYGTPVEVHDGSVAGNAVWLDRTKGNRVRIVLVTGQYCELQYSALASAAASSL